MLAAIRELFAELSGDAPRKSFAEDDQRLAVAALLVHIVSVDGVVTDAEKASLRTVLSERYGLSEGDTESLVAEASRRDDEAVDLYGFTSVLKRNLDEDGRKRVIEMMWETVFADGSVSEFEDNTVWRVAELLGVSSRDRIELKRGAAHRHGADADADADANAAGDVAAEPAPARDLQASSAQAGTVQTGDAEG
jgi:uncharacterized tellurite resistance protein B-like protein